jgi:hypothetical protein
VSRRPRRSVLALLGLSAAAAVGLPVVAATVSGAPVLPDLVSEAPSGEYLSVYSDGRLLLRFDGYVTNSAGAATALEIRASNPQGSYPNEHFMGTVQQFGGMTGPGQGGSPTGPGAGGAPVVKFETADDHEHYHLKDAAEYTLWNEQRTAQVALAQKTEAGFCLEDSIQAGGGEAQYAVSQSNFCRNVPLVMGISPGWKDEYSDLLTYQWVDVTNVQPGRYVLAGRVDPRNVIAESNEANNGYAFKGSATTIPGFLAQPLTTPQTGSAKTVTLQAAQFGSPGGTRVFKILTGPAHGTLNVPVGTTFVGPNVTYTPKAGYLGSDSFTYAAITNGSPYPQTPAGAAATLAGNSVSVAISGAPAKLLVGTSAQLSATVANAPGGVTWSASAGTISPAGLYVAPAKQPAGGSATVRATSQEEPSASAVATIAIAPAGKPKPAPGIANMAAGRKMLSSLKIGRRGARTIVGKVVTGSRGGRLVFTATFNGKVLGRCSSKPKARRAVICKFTLKRSYPLTKVKITAKLTVAGGKTAVRRSFVKR